MDSEFNPIEIAGLLCERIKNIYSKNDSWVNCYHDVSSKYSDLLENMNIFYPELEKHDLFKKALDMNDLYLKEAIEFKKECST